MSAVSPDKMTRRRGRAASAIYAFDRFLQKRESVYEYSDDPRCLFRIQRAKIERGLTLHDGTVLCKGDPAMKLHFWNEHVPPIRPDGAMAAWALKFTRRVIPSLKELEHHISTLPDGDAIAAIWGDLGLGTAKQNEGLAAVATHFGFESFEGDRGPPRSTLHRLGENTLMLFLVLATNPASARLAVLRRTRKPLYMSRNVLRQYLGGPRDPALATERVS